jgi:hypothetical protein
MRLAAGAISNTVWIMRQPGGFVAVDYHGNMIAHHKHQSTLAYIIRTLIMAGELNATAIAVVVPKRRSRGPNRVRGLR